MKILDIIRKNDISKIISVRALDGSAYSELSLVSPEEAYSMQLSTDTGWPVMWTAEGDVLTLVPAPTAATTLSVRVVVSEPDLANDTDTPIMPTRS
jgi:hypothetical protein